jgi:hypothetical protein
MLLLASGSYLISDLRLSACPIILKFNKLRSNRQSDPRIPTLIGSNAGPTHHLSNSGKILPNFGPKSLEKNDEGNNP